MTKMFPAPFEGWTAANAECKSGVSNGKIKSSQKWISLKINILKI